MQSENCDAGQQDIFSPLRTPTNQSDENILSGVNFNTTIGIDYGTSVLKYYKWNLCVFHSLTALWFTLNVTTASAKPDRMELSRTGDFTRICLLETILNMFEKLRRVMRPHTQRLHRVMWPA